MPRACCQGPVGRNKPAQFRHRGSAFAVGLPELRKLVPAYISRPYFFFLLTPFGAATGTMAGNGDG